MNAISLSQAAALAFALAAGLAAQTEAAAPLLIVRSKEPRWLEALAHRYDTKVPEPAPRDATEFVLAADGRATVRAATALPGTIAATIDVRPAAWMAHDPAVIASLHKTWGPRLDVFARQFGMRDRMGRELLARALEVVRAVERVTATVDSTDERSFDLRITLHAASHSPMQRWLAVLQPQAVPAMLPPGPEPALMLQLSVAPESLAGAFEPFVEQIAAIGGADADEQDAAEEDLRAFARTLDGTFALCLHSGGLYYLTGLRDAVAFTARATDPKRLARQRAQLERQRSEAEFTPAAFSHRGIAVMRSRVASDAIARLLPDADELVAHGACVAGRWLQLGRIDGDAEPMRQAIDALLDARLSPLSPTVPEAPPALLVCEVDLARLSGLLAPRGAEPSGDGAGRRLRLSLSATPQSLQALIELR